MYPTTQSGYKQQVCNTKRIDNSIPYCLWRYVVENMSEMCEKHCLYMGGGYILGRYNTPVRFRLSPRSTNRKRRRSELYQVKCVISTPLTTTGGNEFTLQFNEESFEYYYGCLQNIAIPRFFTNTRWGIVRSELLKHRMPEELLSIVQSFLPLMRELSLDTRKRIKYYDTMCTVYTNITRRIRDNTNLARL